MLLSMQNSNMNTSPNMSILRSDAYNVNYFADQIHKV